MNWLTVTNLQTTDQIDERWYWDEPMDKGFDCHKERLDYGNLATDIQRYLPTSSFLLEIVACCIFYFQEAGYS